MDITRAIICISLFHVYNTQQSRVVVFCPTTKSLLLLSSSSRYDFSQLSRGAAFIISLNASLLFTIVTFRSLSDHDRVCHQPGRGNVCQLIIVEPICFNKQIVKWFLPSNLLTSCRLLHFMPWLLFFTWRKSKSLTWRPEFPVCFEPKTYFIDPGRKREWVGPLFLNSWRNDNDTHVMRARESRFLCLWIECVCQMARQDKMRLCQRAELNSSGLGRASRGEIIRNAVLSDRVYCAGNCIALRWIFQVLPGVYITSESSPRR